MRFTHSRITRALITLVVTGCIGGDGSGLMGISGGGGGTASNTPPVLSFFTQPSAADVGQILPAVQVVARDSLGGTDSTFTGSVAIALASNSSGGSLSGTTAVRPINGIATFDNLAIDKAGTYTLRASTSGSAAVTSSAFSITTVTAP